ncbi:hypothetical protein STEG23_025082 [Scotinomys teguina]
MAMHMVLVILSLLPLLEAQNPEHVNITGIPITNDTLNWLSGKWFYIGSAINNLEFKQLVEKVEAEYFYFTSNVTEDTILFHEYLTTENRCVYNVSKLKVQRENGTLSISEEPLKLLGHLKVLKTHEGFLLAFAPEDEKNQALSLYANKPDISPEFHEEFHKTVESMGMKVSEIIYTDWKKDMCSQLEKQSEKERKKTEEVS